MSALTVAEVLDRAADLIEPEGKWLQGEFCDAFDAGQATCWCIEGAIAVVRGKSDFMDAERWCDLHLSPLVFAGGNAARWNDEDGRTQAEVVAKLREAAALAREQGK